MKKILACIVMVALVAVPTIAFGDGADRSRALIKSRLVGSQPDTPIRGVDSGGAPWVISDNALALVRRSGRVRVIVRGLLLTNTGDPNLDGTTGPVRRVFASVTCTTPGGGSAVVNTAVVPLSAAGNARIRDDVNLPGVCFGVSVLVRGDLGTRAGPDAADPWFAVTGF